AKTIGIYTDWRGSLVRAATLPAYGNEYGVLYGITCSVQGSRHLVTDHDFHIKFGTHSWMRQDTVYAWHGPALKLFARGPARRLRGAPSPALVGMQCGHLPRVASAPAKRGRTTQRTAPPPRAPTDPGIGIAPMSCERPRG
ncbi:MAG: hypothetical protein ACXVH3_38000, partial [Solirubrobacteraceae bacterium]